MESYKTEEGNVVTKRFYIPSQWSKKKEFRELIEHNFAVLDAQSALQCIEDRLRKLGYMEDNHIMVLDYLHFMLVDMLFKNKEIFITKSQIKCNETIQKLLNHSTPNFIIKKSGNRTKPLLLYIADINTSELTSDYEKLEFFADCKVVTQYNFNFELQSLFSQTDLDDLFNNYQSFMAEYQYWRICLKLQKILFYKKKTSIEIASLEEPDDATILKQQQYISTLAEFAGRVLDQEDFFTRAPSNFLVKSASNFGEEAAKILGDRVEESVKNLSHDVNNTIREVVHEVSSGVGTTVSDFISKFKETGVESFTEWGISIERAFLHLGLKLEQGLSNAGTRVAVGIKDSILVGLDHIGNGIDNGATKLSQELGIQQVKEWKTLFAREINIFLLGFLILCVSIFIYSVSCLLQASNAVLAIPITYWLNFVTFVIFGLLNGYILYVWSNAMQQQQQPLHSSTTSVQQEMLAMQTPKALIFMVAMVGLVAGQLLSNLLQLTRSNVLNVFLSNLIMIGSMAITYKFYTLQFVYYIVNLYKNVKLFLEWKKQRQEMEATTTTARSTAPVMSVGPSILLEQETPMQTPLEEKSFITSQSSASPNLLTPNIVEDKKNV